MRALRCCLPALLLLTMLGLTSAPASASTTGSGIWSWGLNIQGTLGDGTNTSSLTAVGVDLSGALAGKTIAKVASNSQTACALTTDGGVYCWGYGGNGELGNGGRNSSNVPVSIDKTGVLAGKTLVDVNILAYAACVLDSDGRVYCWGANDNGQLGVNNGGRASLTPVAVDVTTALAGRRVTALSSGGFATQCAVLDNGGASCWGAGTFGQMGDGSNDIENALPRSVTMSGALNGRTISSMSAGTFHVCALLDNGRVSCWGRNNLGQLGVGDSTDRNLPVLVDVSGALSGFTVTALAAGDDTTCVIASNGRGYCWGSGGYGALGTGSTANVNTPTAVSTSGVLAGETLTAISIGAYAHTCAVTASNAVACWGKNDEGQLGDGTRTDSSSPVRVVDTAFSGGSIVGVSATTYATFVWNSTGSAGSAARVLGVGIADVLQQIPVDGTEECTKIDRPELDWAGVPSGGWGLSWAEWVNERRGGVVCTRTLRYWQSPGRWEVVR